MKKVQKNNLWLAFEWPGVHMYQCFAPMRAWQQDFKALGFGLKKMVAVYSKGTTGFYVLQNDYEQTGKKFFESIQTKPEILFSILGKVDEAAEHIFALGKKMNSLNFAELSDQQLLNYHAQLFFWDEKLWRSGQPQNLLELHNNYLTSHVRQLLIKTFGKSKELDYFRILTTQTFQSKLEQQDREFIKLFQKTRAVAAHSLARNSLLKKHSLAYTWMTYGWEGPALAADYFAANILEARKNTKILKAVGEKFKEKEHTLTQQQKLIDQFKPADKKLVLLLRTLVDSKAKRIDAHSQTYYLADKIMAEIAKRKHLSVNQLKVVKPQSMGGVFKKPNIRALNSEYNLVVYWYENGKSVKKYTGKAGEGKCEYLKKHLPKIKATNTLRGELAYQGKVRGRVRVVLYAQGFKNFKKGEILVTRITDPSYVPIMKLSKAIVTEVGGITSHAAIVARELKKPCIIGTKVATKVLKDGDLVEVDANKGIVRKL